MTFGVNDYPGGAAPESNGHDRWGYAWEQCTSFGMHRIVDDLKQGPFYWGNGGDWWRNAQSLGKQVDHTASVGAVFSIPPGVNGVSIFGHTGVVLQVDAAHGQFLAEDYNWKPLAYDQHWLPISGTYFIHLGPLPFGNVIGSEGGTAIQETHPADPFFVAQLIVALVFGRGVGADTVNAIAADVQNLGQIQALYKWADAAAKTGEITLLDRVQNLRTDHTHTAQHGHTKAQVT